MSSTITKTYAPIVRYLGPADGVTFVGTESANEALLTADGSKYIVLVAKNEESSTLGAGTSTSPTYDSTIPAGAAVTSVAITVRCAFGDVPTGPRNEALNLGVGPSTVHSLDMDSTQFVAWEDRMEVKDYFWASFSGTQTTFLPTLEELWNSTYYSVNLSAPSVPATYAALYLDYFSYTVTFTLTPTMPTSVTAYETTPYSAKVRASVNTESCINSTYPMTAWFEWTALDPTNADDLTDFPIETTPVQTFTSDPPLHPEGREGQFVFYDTLPSPLDVQNPRNRLQPNTTYWVRAATAVNGETLYSAAWTSFTTPSNDKVVL